MRIGIDIDDVITDSTTLINEYAMKHYECTDNETLLNIMFAHKMDDKLLDFYQKYLPELQTNYQLKSNVKEVINRLRQKGHQVILITGRGNAESHPALSKLNQIDITKAYFKKHQIIVDEIIFKMMNKKEACINNKIDIMVDDSVKVLEGLIDTKTKRLLFLSSLNKKDQNRFDHVSSWLELEEYINALDK